MCLGPSTLIKCDKKNARQKERVIIISPLLQTKTLSSSSSSSSSQRSSCQSRRHATDFGGDPNDASFSDDDFDERNNIIGKSGGFCGAKNKCFVRCKQPTKEMAFRDTITFPKTVCDFENVLDDDDGE